jgi:hypothetical protein
MAIYHFSVKTISRKEGRSVVAAAAYRTAEKLKCDYYGKEQDYTKKSGVEFKKIYAPDNTKSELLDRQHLWNEVEKVERRKDALLAREFEIAFPSELNANERQKMLDELCQSIVKRHGAIVDAAIHAPHKNSGSDERNYHAHIMFTTRSVNEHGEFEAKKFRDFSRDNGTETVSHWRKAFADIANSHLKAAGHEIRIDHRSYLEQENGLESTKHEGPAVTALRRQYEREKQKPFFVQSLEIVMPAIAAENDRILERNAEKQLIKGIDLEVIASERTICDLTAIKKKKDAEVALEQKNALERKREQNLARELEQATRRASSFHASYQNFCKNFDANLNIDEQFKYVKSENAFELAKQYLLDFELLQKHGLEPKPEKLSLWQKLKGEKEKEFTQIESVQTDLDNFFPILFNDYSNFVESQKQQQKEEEQQRIKRDQEQRKRKDEEQQKILELEKLQKNYNYSDNYDYNGLENWITNHIGLELMYVYKNKHREYSQLSNERYKEIEKLYTESTFRKHSPSLPAEFVFESVLKLIESDKKVAKDFMPSQFAHIQKIETKVKEYFKNSYEVKNEPINSYQKNYNYDLDNKPKPKPENNNDFEM